MRARLAAAAVAALALVALLAATPAAAYTRPEVVDVLLKAKAELSKRGPHWTESMANWICDPAAEKGGPGCDPCAPGSDEFWSVWDHIACRGPNSYLDDQPGGGGDGQVTNIHFTMGKGIEGPDVTRVVELFCPLGRATHEIDITSSQNNPDPSKHLSGPLPPQIADCFPELHQFEWSYNSLDGELPTWPTRMINLSYFKMRANNFTGPIPPEFGSMPQLFRLDLGKNRLATPGPAAVPLTFRDHPTLGIFQIDGNAALTGHVLGLAGAELQVAMLSPNAGLCGPIPSSVRWAVGFNTTGTALGRPCPGGYGDGGNPSTPERAPAAAGGPAAAPEGAPAQPRRAVEPAPAPAVAPAAPAAAPEVAAAGGPRDARGGDL